jgi:sterol desaturase/sphingolipid hydroxylase (fatty acid hydroxylase superfamily)
LKESPSGELYRGLKRSMALGTLLVVALGAGLLAGWSAGFALALLAGGAAGIANSLLSMFGSERLLDRRNVPAFVLSSFARLCLFGIVPVALALRLPSLWTLIWYFAGFFTPLGLYGLLLKRAYARKID